MTMATQSDKCSILFLSIFAFALLGGCDRMMTPPSTQVLKDADAKTSQGDYSRAISLYEAALDDSPRCADIHYKLALLYEDKLNDPLNALHHFKRYLTLAPNGPHATEVKGLMTRDEVALATTLSGDSVVTRNEAARLRNENLALHKQVDERSGKARAVTADVHIEKATAVTKSEPHAYVVQSGDTLFSISRKFYKSSARWKQIRDANRDKIDNPAKLKPGESLTIP
jgi:LysM repeat protein